MFRRGTRRKPLGRHESEMTILDMNMNTSSSRYAGQCSFKGKIQKNRFYKIFYIQFLLKLKPKSRDAFR